ncbi:MAG TPA: hypothetical protein VEG63_11285, partial [Candidatus Acidoferrales bacterium]|nr:hypothetical protein [Candidatus Acidoferrales bacterium]
MQPNLLDGDLVEIAPLLGEKLQRGVIALTRTEDGFVLHRVVTCDEEADTVVTRGDAGQEEDPAPLAILGKAVAIERNGTRISLSGFGTSAVHALRTLVHRALRAAQIRLPAFRRALGPLIFLLFAFLAHSPSSAGQAYTITNTAIAATVGPGQPITYTQVLTNNSGRTVTANSTVTQTVPANTTFENISYTGHGTWTCANNAGTVTCTDTANYTTGNTTTFTLVVAVNTGTANGTVITDTVSAKGANTGTVTATATVTIATADLSMTQVASPAAVAPGANITYTETVTNNGPSAAVGAALYQQTPPNTTFVSMTPPAGWTCGTVPGAGGTGQVICTANANMNANTTTG